LNRIKVSFLDLCSDWPTYTFTNLTIIVFTDWRDFSSCTGKECFICDVELITGNTAFNYVITQVFSNGNNGLTTNTIQRTTCDIRRMNHTITYQEYVFAWTLAYIALRVEQHCFVIP